MPEGYGEFGLEITNPIPASSVSASYDYLRRLRTADGREILFNRIGSMTSPPNIEHIIDGYNLFVDKQKVATIYICPYSTDTSSKAPKGFQLIARKEETQKRNDNKYNLIDTFFREEGEYIRFLVGLKKRFIANKEGTCMATLEKQEGCFLYLLTWERDGKYIGDYVKPFRATKENIKTFNEGCKILAKRLEIFIDTNDANKIPDDFPAFGHLTVIK